MKFWHIAVKDLRIRVRDRSAFVVLLIIPLFMIVVLGTVFNWTGSSFTANIAVVDLDHGDMAQHLTQDVFKSESLKDLLVVTTVATEAEARRLVEHNETGAAVIIPAGFTEEVKAGRKASVIVLGNPEATTQAGIAHAIVESFTAEVQQRQLAASVAIDTLRRNATLSPRQMQEVVQEVLQQVNASERRRLVSVQTTALEGIRVPSALDYYAVGMALLYLVFTANTGTEAMLEEKRQHTLQRVSVTPTSRFHIILGKLIGIFLLSGLQFAVIMAFTRFVYGVRWGSSIPAVLAMAASTVLAGAGLSTFVAALARTPEQAGSVGPAVAMVYSLLGGSMWPVYNMPGWMTSLSRLTFTRWSIEGFTHLMVYGGGLSSVLRPVTVCLVMAAAFLFVSAAIFSRDYR